jgi:DNA-binding MarR family transcriptional regulator
MKPNTSPAPLVLHEFLPHRLSVLMNTISTALSREYAARFELTIPQWRVMAVLGIEAGLSANEVGEQTAMDKVTVSRAVAGLVRAGRVVKRVDREDRRHVRLRLSARGLAIYAEIVPRARRVERQLLGSLSSRDVAELDRLLAALWDAAQQLDGARERAA